MKKWKFGLGTDAKVPNSGEEGTIIGRAEFTTGEDQYLLLHKPSDGQGMEEWLPESRLAHQ